MSNSRAEVRTIACKTSFSSRLYRDMRRNWQVYLMALPVLIFYTVFCYRPMYGAIIAFKDFSPKLGIMGSHWAGLKYFREFFTGPFFSRTLGNTLIISISQLLFSFPAPIILALLINELRSRRFSRIVQTISYLPHFISLVVVCSIIKEFTAYNGLINDIVGFLGGQRQNLLGNPSAFVPVYVLSDIWQSVGWGSIIYLAALTGVDQELYEAAMIDGAGRWRQARSITLPSIMPTIIVMLILRIGGIMNVGYEKIILLYNPAIYETADVISSFVYRKGILERSYSFSAAVGLFNSAINCVLLFSSNWLSRKFNDVGLW